VAVSKLTDKPKIIWKAEYSASHIILMRLLLLVTLFGFTTTTFGQNTTLDNSDSVICTLPVSCVTLANEKPIKPFISDGNYLGKVIIQAQLDTLTMKLVRHKIVYADLYSKIDPNKKIEVRLSDQLGDKKYLNNIFPELIKHLEYLKFKIVAHKDCNMTTSWNFPITIKPSNANR
jgi:hypothetical protein